MDRTQKDNYQDQDKTDGNRDYIWVSIHYVGEKNDVLLLHFRGKLSVIPIKVLNSKQHKEHRNSHFMQTWKKKMFQSLCHMLYPGCKAEYIDQIKGNLCTRL